jgi:hypothetical protein
MPKIKTNFFTAAVPLIILLLMAGSAHAGTMAIENDKVDFELTRVSTYIEGTPAWQDATDIATVDFKMAFHPGEVPVGTIQKLVIKFTYPVDFVTFQYAEPASIWGSLVEGTDYSVIHDEENGVVFLMIDPEQDTNIWATSYTRTMAHFIFKAVCQPMEHINDLEFTTIGDIAESYVDVKLTTDVTNTYQPHTDYITNGWVRTYMYWVDFRVVSQELRGVLGRIIEVPVTGWANGLVDGVNFSITYDTEKLNFIDVVEYGSFFPAGFNDPAFPHPSPGDNPVRICLNTGDYFDANLYQQAYVRDTIFKLQFEVLGEWDGESSTIDFLYPLFDPDFFVKIGQGGEGYCLEVSQSILGSTYGVHLGSGTQTIIPYAAGLESRLLGEMHIWDTPDSYQPLDFAIKLCNNFPAGTQTADYDGAITAIVDPPDILEYQFGPLSQIPGSPVIFQYEYSSGSHDTLTYYSEYTVGYDNFFDISECDLPEEGGVDIVNLPFELDDASVTAYSNDTYELTVVPNVSTHANPSMIEAAHCGRTLTDGGGLTLSAVPFEIEMGLFSCNTPCNGSGGAVSQEIYVRNSFNMASFYVKVAVVSGPHYINEIHPVSGVTVVDWEGKYAILASDNDWAPAEHLDLFPIATIDYSFSAPQIPAKVIPGPGDCWWERRTSIIELQDGFMSDLAGDDHLNPQGNQPFLFADDGTVCSSVRKCNHVVEDVDEAAEEERKMAYESLPTEFSLHQNYPNPFNPSTIVAYDIPVSCHVRIEIFNILGQRVITLVDEAKEAGRYQANWNSTDASGRRVSSGVYLYVMKAGQYSRTMKMLLMK